MVPSNDSTAQRCEEVLAALRITARQHKGGSVELGEELVELTLKTAIDEYDRRPASMDLLKWLSGIMRRNLN